MTREEHDACRARSVHDHAREIATARGPESPGWLELRRKPSGVSAWVHDVHDEAAIRLDDSLGHAVTDQQMRREL